MMLSLSELFGSVQTHKTIIREKQSLYLNLNLYQYCEKSAVIRNVVLLINLVDTTAFMSVYFSNRCFCIVEEERLRGFSNSRFLPLEHEYFVRV